MSASFDYSSFPLIDCRPPSSLIRSTDPILFKPDFPLSLSVSLALIIGRPGHNVSLAQSMSLVGAYSLALDFSTINNKDDNPPFIGISTSLSRPVAAAAIDDPHRLRLWMQINDTVVQDGSLLDTISTNTNNTSNVYYNSIPEVVSKLSHFSPLQPHDVIIIRLNDNLLSQVGHDHTVLAGAQIEGASKPVLTLQHQVQSVF